jgi:drug/metabolite transporter (DMT)-like permease
MRLKSHFYVLILLCGGALAGLAPIFVRLSQIGPFAIGFWRMAIALPVLAAWLSIDKKRKPGHITPAGLKDYLHLGIGGIFFALDVCAWHLSIQYTSVANATVLANLAPVFVVLGTLLVLRQRVEGILVLGVAIALLGSALLVGQGFSLGYRHVLGDGFGLLTAVFYAGYILSLKHLRGKFATSTIMTWICIFTLIVILPISLTSKQPFFPQTLSGWLPLLGLGLVSHIIVHSIITFALAHLSAPFSSVTLLLQPVAAALFAWIIFTEGISPLQGLGGLLILAGIFIARQRPE